MVGIFFAGSKRKRKGVNDVIKIKHIVTYLKINS
jgi:hypothetical protein